jgi:hypothetical protein
MEMTPSIVNEELYRQDLRKHYDSILNNRIFSIDTRTAKDEDLLSFLSDYNTERSENDNFFTWLSIGDIVDSEYVGKGIPYSFVVFLAKDSNHAFTINFSQFKYPMSEYTFPPRFNADRAKYTCTVDGMTINPEVFFSEHKGERILLMYSFKALTKFGHVKRCYRFALTNTTPSHLRKYVRQVQITLLKQTLDNPAIESPETQIQFLNNKTSGKNLLAINFASKLFEHEYKDRFLTKLNGIEKG